MIKVDDQEIFNDVLVGLGFITVSMPCFFTYEETPEPVDIHFTTNPQINGADGKTLYIKNPHQNPSNEGVAKLSYAIGVV